MLPRSYRRRDKSFFFDIYTIFWLYIQSFDLVTKIPRLQNHLDIEAQPISILSRRFHRDSSGSSQSMSRRCKTW